MTGATVLRGREHELTALATLLADAAAGTSGVLVVDGEAGIGKTALIDAALARAPRGTRVVRALAVESEMELPYAALHQLTSSIADGMARLPDPQREALEAAFGLRAVDGPAPSPFLVGLATLGLLVEAAAEQPLACVVDDAQWLDAASAQALAFVARRLGAERVALIVAMRAAGGAFDDLPRLTLAGLDDEDARTLFAQALPGATDPRARDQLLAEARGNPLALRELPRAVRPAEVAGGPVAARATPLIARIEASLLGQLEPLPADARLLLLLAALEPTGDPVLLRHAAAALGLGADAFAAAESAGALVVGARVELRHPLVRSTVHHAASPDDRRRAHAALADATSAETDPDRRAWHRAQATLVPDEEVAAALERTAARARARGGAAAAAAFLERAAALTPDPARAGLRLLAAADAKLTAGAPDEALRLVGVAREDELTPRDRAVAARLRAQADYARHRDVSAAPALVAAADRVAAFDPVAARDTYLDAIGVAQYAARLADGGDAASVGRAVLAATAGDEPQRPADLVLRGQALLATGDHAGAVPVLRRVLAAFDPAAADERDLRWILLACRAAIDVWDVEALRTLSQAQVDLARARGVLSVLPTALNLRCVAVILDGKIDAATALADEIDVVKQVTRQPFPELTRTLIAAWRGRASEAERRIADLRADAAARGEGVGLTGSEYAELILYNGLGRHAEAFDAGRRLLPHTRELGMAMRAMGELVEAAIHVGEHGVAAQALERLATTTRPVGGPWAGGVLAAATALVAADDPAAEDHHLAAIAHLGQGRLPLLEARARLAYGEWLRRRRRRVDAREHLREAHRLLETRGARGFAARAARELEATGETARARTEDTGDALTAQELNVARLASDGLTNRDIATRLFISARTVEYHLRKVYNKLDITSRRELATVLGAYD